MTAHLVSLAGYLLAAIMAMVAFYCWRKGMSIHNLLMESANHLEKVRRKGQQLEKDLVKTKEKLSQNRKGLDRAEKDMGSAQTKSEGLASKLGNIEEKHNQELHTQDLKLEHLKKQVESLTAQLKEIDGEKKEVQNELSFLKREFDEKVASSQEPMKAKVTELKKKFKVVEGENQHLQKQIAKIKKIAVHPEVVKTLKRRLHHLDSLFMSMKGLREMADERNKNWEVALAKLSKWILRNSDSKLAKSDNTNIGPMVGEALEIIGAKLVHDEFAAGGHHHQQPENQQQKTVTASQPASCPPTSDLA